MTGLVGIPILVLGLALRFNPLLVVTAAALAAGLAAGVAPLSLVAALGRAFNDARYISLIFLVLPVIGLMERAGLRAKARALVARAGAFTPGRLLLVYLMARQASAAAGLLALGGQANMVRPLVAPMAEAVAETRHGPAPPERGVLIRGHAAAADNVGGYFGEDVFVALGSVLLIVAVLKANRLAVAPAAVAILALPTAVVALLVHGARLLILDRRLARGAGR